MFPQVSGHGPLFLAAAWCTGKRTVAPLWEFSLSNNHLGCSQTILDSLAKLFLSDRPAERPSDYSLGALPSIL
jgi:hypothetical protein